MCDVVSLASCTNDTQLDFAVSMASERSQLRELVENWNNKPVISQAKTFRCLVFEFGPMTNLKEQLSEKSGHHEPITFRFYLWAYCRAFLDAWNVALDHQVLTVWLRRFCSWLELELYALLDLCVCQAMEVEQNDLSSLDNSPVDSWAMASVRVRARQQNSAPGAASSATKVSLLLPFQFFLSEARSPSFRTCTEVPTRLHFTDAQ